MMATRTLKFKPKPILGSNIRRLPVRDNSEISVPTTTPATEKELSTAIVETLKASDAAQICRNILPTNSEEAGKNLPSDKLITEDNNKVVSDNNLQECIIQGNPSVHINTSVIENAKPSVTTELKDLPDSSLLCRQPSDISCKTTENLSSNTEDNKIEAGNNKVKTNSVPVKADILKGLSRFGRARCKPVLNCAPRRNATRISNDEPKLDNALVVERTESVIKSVQLELSKTPAGPSESELDNVSKTSDEIIYHEDGSDKSSMDREIEMINESTIGTKELVANKSSSLQLASDETTDVSYLPMSQQIPTQDDSRSFDAIISKSNKTEIHNQPVEAVLQSNENAKEAECSNASQSVQTPKVLLSPLRTTSKILVPKPSPRIRDGIRRISFQGSDSEEDLKRKKELTNFKDKDRKDGVKSVKRKKSHGSTYSKMGEETLVKFYEKFGRYDKPDKAKLTMMDLIFYNPTDNPMSKTLPKIHTATGKKEIKMDVSEELGDTLAEQAVDDVEPAPAVPVPQLKIGPDGQIMLDPKSLIIETTGTQKSREELEQSQVIQESGITRYSTYSKRKPRRSDWNAVETLQFYKALSTIGPDFTLMTQLFPKRNRHDLKLKFKKEDKLNRVLVDKAMTGQVDFDFKTLQEELKRENDEIEDKKLRKELYKKQKKEDRLKAIAEKKQLAAERKENKKNIQRRRKTPCSTEILDTDEDVTDEEGEKHKQDAIMKMAKCRRPVLKKIKNSVSDVENELDDVEFPKEDKHSHKPKHQGAKKIRKLNEYHEMNESLKKNLCSGSAMVKNLDDLDAEDRYTPNGSGVDALFRSPTATAEHADSEQWNIDITSVPPIEETVLLNNIETVSEISELGSFGQESDTVLDLSMTDRTLEHRPYLDRRIISESMEIVDQLSSHVKNKTCADKTDASENEEETESILPLPSFETVVGARPSFRYPLESSEIVTPSQASEDTSVEIRTSTEDLQVSDYQDQSELILGD